MEHTITELNLYAGPMGDEDDTKEAYLMDSEDCEFIRVELSTCTKKTFEFKFYGPEKKELGKLEFDREQAYFLNAWLSVWLAK